MLSLNRLPSPPCSLGDNYWYFVGAFAERGQSLPEAAQERVVEDARTKRSGTPSRLLREALRLAMSQPFHHLNWTEYQTSDLSVGSSNPYGRAKKVNNRSYRIVSD